MKTNLRLRRFTVRGLLLASVVATSASCGTLRPTLAPGADRVKLTHNASEVAGCKVVGNVSGWTVVGDNRYNYEEQLRNQTVGLDGNTVFLTTTGEGVAYRCP